MVALVHFAERVAIFLAINVIFRDSATHVRLCVVRRAICVNSGLNCV